LKQVNVKIIEAEFEFFILNFSLKIKNLSVSTFVSTSLNEIFGNIVIDVTNRGLPL